MAIAITHPYVVNIQMENEMTTSQISATLDKMSDTIAKIPEKAVAKHESATARLADGLKFQITGPSGMMVETDMPFAMGGSASQPNPGWMFRASLASCCATVIAMRAAQTNIDLTMLEVQVDSGGDLRGILGIDDEISAGMTSLTTKVRIAAHNATPSQLEELVKWGNAHAPVGCTVQNAATNSLKIEIA
jgi:uncharacterized OsmC-like protein